MWTWLKRAVKQPVLWVADNGAGVLFAVLGFVFASLGLATGWTNWSERARFAKAEGEVVELVRQVETSAIGALDMDSDTATSAKTGEPEKPAATVGAEGQDKAGAKPAVQYIPTIRFETGAREAVSFKGPQCGEPCSFPRPIPVRYDPANPAASAKVDTWWETWGIPTLLAGLGAVVLAFSTRMFGKRADIDPKTVFAALDEKLYDLRPLMPATADAYLSSGTGQAPARQPIGLVVTAESIAEGRNPVVLCEFLSYMACLAYEDDTKNDGEEKGKLRAYVESFLGTDTHFRFFNQKGTEGFAFVFEDTAFIVLRGTTDWVDWSQNFRAGWTAPGALQPQGATWKAPPRHQGFAEAWDFIRDSVEDWIKSLPQPPNGRRRFIFSGHSLGGALAFLGAYEFAKQGRDIAAVVTFGAPMPGGSAFKTDYDSLGLGARTLRLVFDYDIVPVVQAPLGYVHVGREWSPQKVPLHSRRALRVAAVLGFPFFLIRRSFTGKTTNETFGKVWSSSLASKAALALAYIGPGAVMALAAHKMQRRYALALSILSYQQIRALVAARPFVDQTFYDECYRALSSHLRQIRGCGPQDDRFGEITRLPNEIRDMTDFRWLSLWYPGRAF